MEVVQRAETRTRDPDEVHELITRRYVDHRPRILGRPEGFTFRSASASAGGLTVDHITWAATMDIRADPFDTVLIVSVLDGRFDVSSGRDRVSAGRGEAVLYLPGVPPHVVMDRMTYQVAQFPLAAVARLAGRLGVDPRDFRFERMVPAGAAAHRHWLSTMAYLTRLFTGSRPPVEHPLMLAAALEVAAATALAVFPNTTMTAHHVADRDRTAPAVLRRAVDYIDAHAGEPITVERIAAVAGGSVRGLQAAFRRHRDTTPTAYLRRVRMERAHRDLLAADPAGGDTVAGIARRWGFAAPGRFSVEYRKAFGRTPGTTLRS